MLQAGPWEGEVLTSLSTCISLNREDCSFTHRDFWQRLSNITSTHLTLKAGEFHTERSAMGWSFGTAASTQSLARTPLLTSNEKLNTIKTILALCIIMQTRAMLIPCWESFTPMWIWHIAQARSTSVVQTLLSTQDAKIPHLCALHIPRHVALGAASICRGTLTSSSWSLSLSSYHSCQQPIKAQRQPCISHIPSSKPPEGFFKCVADQKHLLQITL